MRGVLYGPKMSILGNVFRERKGFYWYVEIVIEGYGEKHLALDSRKGDRWFKTHKEAQEDLDNAGGEITSIIADAIRPADGFVDVIDRNKIT